MSYIGNTPTTQSFISGTDYFNGTGAQTAFTLSRTVASVNDIQAVVNNVVQVPNDAYTISGTTITFTSAPSSGTQNVYVRYLSTTTQAITPSQGTVGTAQLGTITNIASGNTALTLQTGSTPTTAVTIDTSQNVGIGTTSPDGKLTIETANSNTPRIRFQNASFDGDAAISTFVSSTGTDLVLGSNLYINSSGNLARFDSAQAGSYVYAGRTGILYFGTNDTSGVATERMRIDSGGRVTMSAQPCFFAYSYSNNTQDVAKSFDTIPINVGSCYNNANGRFTAPVAGIYEFRASYIGVQSSDTVTRLKFFKNDAIVLNGDASVGRLDGTATGSELPFGEVTVFLNLAASDYITNVVSTDSGASLTNLGWGKFCGRLMQ
jgi:hypothetical protein